MKAFLTACLVIFVRAYQLGISPLLGPRCRFYQAVRTMPLSHCVHTAPSKKVG